MMKIGFTGTRSGCSSDQKNAVRLAMMVHQPGLAIHGGCVGADMDFHDIALELGWTVEVRPGHSAKGFDRPDLVGDFSPGAMVKVHASKTHFARNRDIVASCDMLLACPYNEVQRGGTWYTINHALKVGRSCVILTR